MEKTESRIPNREQQAVIDELDKNILLFASAGTGKTFTVAKRVEHILQAGKAQPGEILCLTFTIKAAREMQQDILTYVGEAGAQVQLSTIHSFAYRVLKEESLRNTEIYSMPSVCDDVDETEILKEVLLGMGLSEKSPLMSSKSGLNNFVTELKHRREMLLCFSRDEVADYTRVYRDLKQNDVKKFRKLVNIYIKAARGEVTDEAFVALMDVRVGEFMSSYQQALRKRNLLDFDDLICRSHRLFQDKEARERWGRRFRYIILDEMQDTSLLEYDTLKQLFSGNHIMMCGDYFQTIYEWRGSQPERVLEDYRLRYHAETYSFATNYRSTRLLSRASFGFLKNSYPDLLGKYCPAELLSESKAEGDKIRHVVVPNLQAEAAWIYRYLEEHPMEDPTRLCIMARSNGYIEALGTELEKIAQGLPEERRLRFFTVEKEYRFFRRAIIKDMLAFMSLLVNPTDLLSMERIAGNFVTGVGPKGRQEIARHGECGLDLCSFLQTETYTQGDPYALLLRAFAAGKVVIYDTETTGLDLSKDQMIQISAIRLDGQGRIAESLDQMVIPEVPISAGAQATHHVTMADILQRGGVPAGEALKRFAAFTEGCVLVGHNSMRFDAPLVRRQLRECGLPALHTLGEYDTLVIAKQLYPRSVNYKLETLCGRFGIVNEAAHDALGDVTATGKVLQQMITQALLPREAERRQTVAAFAPKLEKFYEYMQQQRREKLAENRLYDLMVDMTARFRFRTGGKYKDDQSALSAMDDLLYAIRTSKITDAESYILEMLEDAALSGSQMDILIQKLHKIPIITVHQTKGCEFDTTLIAGASEGIFPGYSAVKEGNVAEEMRVFYVAITRAKQKLILLSPRYRPGSSYEMPPCRFIQQIPKECMERESS